MRTSRVACLLALPFMVSACATTGGARGGAPDFTLKGVDGRPVRLSQHLGNKVVLLNFWATRCTPCAYELPHLQALQEKYKDQGLQVISIAMDGPETVASVAPFVRRQGITYPVLLDVESRATGLYNPRRSAPFNVIIGRDSQVVSAREGFAQGDEIELEKTVVALLQGATLPPPAPAAVSERPVAPPCLDPAAQPPAEVAH